MYPSKNIEDFPFKKPRNQFICNLYHVIRELNLWDFVEKNAKYFIEFPCPGFYIEFGNDQNYLMLKNHKKLSNQINSQTEPQSLYLGLIVMAYIARDGFDCLSEIGPKLEKKWDAPI